MREGRNSGSREIQGAVGGGGNGTLEHANKLNILLRFLFMV